MQIERGGTRLIRERRPEAWCSAIPPCKSVERDFWSSIGTRGATVHRFVRRKECWGVAFLLAALPRVGVRRGSYVILVMDTGVGCVLTAVC